MNQKLKWADGIQASITAHCQRRNVNRSTVYKRMSLYGMTLQEALDTPAENSFPRRPLPKRAKAIPRALTMAWR